MLAGLLGFCLGSAVSAHAQGFGGFGGSSFGGRGGGGGSSRTSARQYQNNGMIGSATVSVDPETRRIIVITDEDTSLYVGQVITNLDRPKPQVLINVVFLEVTYTDGLDLGVDGRFTHTSPNGNITGYDQSFNKMPGIDTGEGVFKFANKEYAVTLRAIAEAGKLEVLSRPSIMARNNQQATILVGQQVPLINNVRYDTFGNQINGIYYQPIGIQLQVTPFITSGGMVEMIVAPSISNLSDQTVAISTTTNSSVGSPVINTRSADTVVVTPDGHTVIIGGLMQNNKTENVSKIPLLGDIPGVGALFRRTVKKSTKTELIIFLTPHIMLNPTQMDLATERSRESLKKSFTEQDLNKFLEGVPTRPTPTTLTPPGAPGRPPSGAGPQ